MDRSPFAPPTGPPVDAILRDAARHFDVPVALVPPGNPVPSRAYASARITSPAGEPLGFLCILGEPCSPSDGYDGLGQLDGLVARLGEALSAGSASLPTASDRPTPRLATG